MFDEEAARIQLLALQDKSSQRKIQDLAENVLDELVRRLRLDQTSVIQLHNSTDVNLAVVLVFVGCVYESDVSNKRTAYVFESLETSGSYYLRDGT